MATKTQIISRASKGIIPLIRKIISINFFTIILGLFVLYGVILSFQQSSIEPLVTGVGGRATLTLQALNEDSLLIQSSEYDGFGAWKKIWVVLGVLGSFMFILAWLKVWAWVSTHAITGNTSLVMVNYLVALIIFIPIQIIFVLIIGNLDLLGPDYTQSKALALPFLAIKNFVFALPHILEPILRLWDRFFGEGLFQPGNKTIENITNGST